MVRKLKTVFTAMFLLAALFLVATAASACTHTYSIQTLSALMSAPDNFDAFDMSLSGEISGAGQSVSVDMRMKAINREDNQIMSLCMAAQGGGNTESSEMYYLNGYDYTEMNGQEGEVSEVETSPVVAEESYLTDVIDLKALEDIDPKLTYNRREDKYTIIIDDANLSKLLGGMKELVGIDYKFGNFKMDIYVDSQKEIFKQIILNTDFRVQDISFTMKIAMELVAYGNEVEIEIPERVSDAIAAYQSGFRYSLNQDGGSYSVRGTEKLEGELVIPSEYKEKPVTVVRNNGFENNKKITSVVIPDSITEIGQLAFSDCQKLKTIAFGNGLKSIGARAFSDCGITEITIPEGVTEIGESAFLRCASLKTAVLPDSLNEIRFNLFSGCSAMTSVTLGNRIKKIESSAFACCYSLKSILIPNGITTIEDATFAQCTELTSIVIPDSVKHFERYAFVLCSKLTTLQLGKGLTRIDASAFWDVPLSRIYYNGSAADWAKIGIDDYNNQTFLNAQRYYYSETKPSGSGNYWHYADNGITPVVW